MTKEIRTEQQLTKIYTVGPVWPPDFGMTGTQGRILQYSCEEWGMNITVVTTSSTSSPESRAWFGDGENEANEMSRRGQFTDKLADKLFKAFMSAKKPLDVEQTLYYLGFRL